jgi:hypothetical protein
MRIRRIHGLPSTRSLVDEYHARLSFDTGRVRKLRRVNTPIAATMSSTNAVGSGTAEVTFAAELHCFRGEAEEKE